MNLLDPIKTIMTEDLETLSPDQSMADAALLFKKRNIHHIPITVGRALKGMLSITDFHKFFMPDGDNTELLSDINAYMENTQIKDVMITHLATLEPDSKINVALEIFKENMFHAIPIVASGRLEGLVTTYDVIKHLADDKSATNTYTKS